MLARNEHCLFLAKAMTATSKLNYRIDAEIMCVRIDSFNQLVRHS